MRKPRKALLLGLALALVGASAFAQVDLSRYVALGDSLTAGYASGALTQYYQDFSYPAIIARQAGVSNFQQPIIADPGIGSYGTVLELIALSVNPAIPGGVSPVILPTPGNPGMPTNAGLTTPYNNLGIPGANTMDLLTRTGDITKLLSGHIDPNTIMYDLILRDGQHTAIEQALGLQPTFVTVWAGSNDALGAAEAGIVVDDVTLTSTAAFQQAYQTLLGAIKQNAPNAKIVVATIQEVLPYVTALKPYLINPANGSHIPLIGASGLITEQDYLTLPAANLLAQGIGIPAAAGGTGHPLPEGYVDAQGNVHGGVVIRAATMATIMQRIGEYNTVIKATAQAMGAKVVDMNAVFANWDANGYMVGGVHLTTAFLTGGIFSYDGLHNQRLGDALVANEFIKVINREYGAKIPLVNLYPFLVGTPSTTSVAAASFGMSVEAARQLMTMLRPNTLTDQLGVRRVHHHLSVSTTRGLVEPPTP
jgi:lysophospholipase L1-like esterase